MEEHPEKFDDLPPAEAKRARAEMLRTVAALIAALASTATLVVTLIVKT